MSRANAPDWRRSAVTVLVLGTLGASPVRQERTTAEGPRRVVIAREAGRYGGWPANHGIWSWGNEILVGYSWGHMRNGGAESGHPIDRQRPEEHMLARSLDGGETWTREKPAGLTP